jgi:hypothetical protein
MRIIIRRVGRSCKEKIVPRELVRDIFSEKKKFLMGLIFAVFGVFCGA